MSKPTNLNDKDGNLNPDVSGLVNDNLKDLVWKDKPTNGLEELAHKINQDICDWNNPRQLAVSVEDTAMRIAKIIQSNYVPKQQLREALVDENVKHGEFAPAIAREGDKLTRNKLRAELRKKFLDE